MQTLIVNTAIEEASKSDSVLIVGEEDQVILTNFAGSKHNVYFLKQGKGKIENKLYTQASISVGQTLKTIFFSYTQLVGLTQPLPFSSKAN